MISMLIRYDGGAGAASGRVLLVSDGMKCNREMHHTIRIRHLKNATMEGNQSVTEAATRVV